MCGKDLKMEHLFRTMFVIRLKAASYGEKNIPHSDDICPRSMRLIDSNIPGFVLGEIFPCVPYLGLVFAPLMPIYSSRQLLIYST